MIVDCDNCVVRGDACRDCVISVLLGPPPELAKGPSAIVELDSVERQALDTLADAGLVPKLRLVPRSA